MTGRDVSGRRYPGLDLLRVAACAMVVVYHLGTVFDFGALARFTGGMDTGVWVFFVLSGYLLYRPFLRGPVDVRAYTIRRVLRILPAYYVAVVGLTILTGNVAALTRPLTYLVIGEGYDAATFQGFLGPAWTLGVEVAFYVSLPSLAALFSRWPRALPWLGLTSLGSLFIVSALTPNSPARVILPWMFYGFVPGMLMARLSVQSPARFAGLGRPGVAVLGVFLIVAGTLPQAPYIAPLTVLGAALVLPYAARVGLPRPGLWTVLGGMSYAVYLWHWDLLLAYGPLVMLLVVGGIAAASYALLERPAMALAERLTVRVGRKITTAPA